MSLKINRNTKTLRQLGYDKIRQAILESKFKPGERLIERVLCDELGISRPIIREVLRLLEAEKIVEVIPHIGTIVAPIKWESAYQIYQIRSALESMAIVSCTQKATPSDIAQLQLRYEEIIKAFDEHKAFFILQATTAFYEAVFNIGKQAIAWEIVQSLNIRINQLRLMTISEKERHKEAIEEMQNILQAIKSGSEEAAKKASGEHIDKASRIAKKIIDKREEVSGK